MAMFGALSGLGKQGGWQMPPMLSGPTSPPPDPKRQKPRFVDKLGLIGDILTGTDATQQRLMAGQPRFQQIGDSLVQVGADGQISVAFDGRKPAAPHYWETNNGSLGMIGPDGQPRIAYEDPTPKQGVFAIDNADGTKTLYPTVNGVPVGMTQGAGAAAGGAIPLQNGVLPPGFKLRTGGAAPSGQAGFRP